VVFGQRRIQLQAFFVGRGTLCRATWSPQQAKPRLSVAPDRRGDSGAQAGSDSRAEKGPVSGALPPEPKERAVGMAREVADQEGSWSGVIPRPANRLGAGTESLRGWGRQGRDKRQAAGPRITGKASA
jgi:hypothetical protein